MIFQRKSFQNYAKNEIYSTFNDPKGETVYSNACLTDLALRFSAKNRYILHKNAIYRFIISYMSQVSCVLLTLLHFKLILEFLAL